jgi:hypothetical protein
LLRLPNDIIEFPDSNQTPEVLRHFTAKRLDALTRLPDAQAASLFVREVGRLRSRAATCLPVVDE